MVRQRVEMEGKLRKRSTAEELEERGQGRSYPDCLVWQLSEAIQQRSLGPTILVEVAGLAWAAYVRAIAMTWSRKKQDPCVGHAGVVLAVAGA